MTEHELTTTEKNALKWVLFEERYRELRRNSHLLPQDLWHKVVDFMEMMK